MLKELVTCQLDKMIQSSDKKACIYQKRNFIVDEQGGVFGCLNIEHCEENYCGNILKDDIQQIFDNISKRSLHRMHILWGRSDRYVIQIFL